MYLKIKVRVSKVEATVKQKMGYFKKSTCDVCSHESVASVSASGRELLRGC